MYIIKNKYTYFYDYYYLFASAAPVGPLAVLYCIVSNVILYEQNFIDLILCLKFSHLATTARNCDSRNSSPFHLNQGRDLESQGP